MNRKLIFGRYDYAAFLTFACYAMCSVIIPMCLVPLASDLHFPLQEGGMGMGGALQMGRSIPMTLMLLLCGLIGAKYGNRISLGASLLTMALGILLSSLAPGYWFLIPAIAVAGFGEGVIEGLATPFVNDLHDEDTGRYLNFSHSFWSVGVLSAVLCGGALLSFGVSWRIITGGCALAALIPAAMLLLRGKEEQLLPRLLHMPAGIRRISSNAGNDGNDGNDSNDGSGDERKAGKAGHQFCFPATRPL